MTERMVHAGGVDLCLETFGSPTDPALLLVGGAAMSMDWWDARLCARLAATRRLVIRYDHRDTGRSASSPAGSPSYTSNELAADPLRILDALDVDQAHLVGLSMGGGIGQVLAARHRERLSTLTLIATSAAGTRTSRAPLPSMSPAVARLFEAPPPDPDWTDGDAVIEFVVSGQRPYAGSLGLDDDRVRRLAAAVVDRTRDIKASLTNHWILEGEAVEFAMADITAPTLVLHGTDDPFFPIGHGEALRAEIPGAVFVPLPGMGHEVPPPQLWDTVVTSIARHTEPG